MAVATIDDLIDDCLIEIFSYLSLIEITNVYQVCSRWKALSEQLWQPTELIWGRDDVFYLGDKNWKRYRPFSCVDDVMQILKCFGIYIEKYHIANRVIADEIGIALMRTITEYCGNLQEMNSKSVSPPLEFLELISDCTNLERLSIRYIREDCEEALKVMLRNKEKLKFISLEFPNEFDEPAGQFLEYLPKDLEELCIINADNLELRFVISAFISHRLRRLTFDSSHDPIDCDKVIATICEIKTLEHLKLYCPTCDRNSFNQLSRLVGLKKLEIPFSRQLEDYNLTTITNGCKQLEFLDIKQCGLITNQGIAGIAGLKNLEELNISGLIRLTDDALDYLPDSLKRISFKGCEGLNESGIIKLIRNSPNLAQLDITGCSAITVNTFLTAIEETKNRTNNIVLEIYTNKVNDVSAEIMQRCGQEVNKLSPFLRVDYYSNFS